MYAYTSGCQGLLIFAFIIILLILDVWIIEVYHLKYTLKPSLINFQWQYAVTNK